MNDAFEKDCLEILAEKAQARRDSAGASSRNWPRLRLAARRWR